MAVQLEQNYQQELRRIVEQYVDTRRWKPVIFGSRAAGRAQKFSDIDLGFIGSKPLPSSSRVRLWEALDDSNIPYTVDIVDLGSAGVEFNTVARQHMEYL